MRSRDIFQPWPEEVNRRLAAVVTQLHFAPTPLSRDNLLAEEIPRRTTLWSPGTRLSIPCCHLLEMQAMDYPLPESVPDDGSRWC